MVQIRFFISPKSFVKVVTKAGEFVPIVGPLVTYTKNAQKATELANPVSATSRGIGLMFESCFGKTGKVTSECILWATFSIIGGITANPGFIAAGVTFGDMIIEDLIG